MHDMGTIAIDDSTGRLSICLSYRNRLSYSYRRLNFVQTRLNGLKLGLEWRLLGAQETLYYTGVPISPTNSMRLSRNYFGHLFKFRTQ